VNIHKYADVTFADINESTRRNIHSPEMQIGTDSLPCRNPDPNPDLLNPKSIGFDTYQGLLPSFKSF